MTLTTRDRRALIALGGAVAITMVVYFWTESGSSAEVVPPAAESIPVAEKRLGSLREMVATVPGKQQVTEQIAAQVAVLEKGLLSGDTAAQAQASLLQHVRRLAREQAPPVEVAQVEMGPIRPIGKEYGEALVSVSMNCRIEQLLQLLADISARPELIATNEMRVLAGDPKQKLVNVRLTVSGLVARKLVPENKGLGVF